MFIFLVLSLSLCVCVCVCVCVIGEKSYLASSSGPLATWQRQWPFHLPPAVFLFVCVLWIQRDGNKAAHTGPECSAACARWLPRPSWRPRSPRLWQPGSGAVHKDGATMPTGGAVFFPNYAFVCSLASSLFWTSPLARWTRARGSFVCVWAGLSTNIASQRLLGQSQKR